MSAKSFDYSKLGFRYTIACFILGRLSSAIAFGRLSDYYSPRNVMLSVGAFLAMGLLISIFVGSITSLSISQCILGIGAGRYIDCTVDHWASNSATLCRFIFRKT